MGVLTLQIWSRFSFGCKVLVMCSMSMVDDGTRFAALVVPLVPVVMLGSSGLSPSKKVEQSH